MGIASSALEIHYRPLHSEGKFKVVHAGALSFRLIENLDVKTYYAFRIVTKDATGQTYHCETFARTMSDGNQTSCAVKGKLPVAHRMYVSVVVRKPGHNFEEGKLHSYPTKKALLPSQEEKPTKPKLSQDKRKRAFCNNESFLNINWPITSQGETALSWCPFGSRGLAKRQCLEVFGDNTSRWGLPDLSECVSDKMMDIARQLDDPDVDVTEISMQLVNATDITTYTQAPLHTGDLKLVVDLIEKISQKGLGTIQHLPPAIRDENIKQVTQAFVNSSSNIVDDKALESWKFMPEDSRATEASKLLKGVDAIALHFAKTAVASDAIVSEAPNVVLSAKSINDDKPSSQRMPPTSKIMRNFTSSSVLLPGSVLMQQQNEGDRSKTQYITFVSYRNLEALMQPSINEKSSNYTEDESDLGKIESEITSVSLHPMKINSFEDPVVITMKSEQDNSKPQANCVFWNVSGPRGFWSKTGCNLKERNSSHTTCQCYHLTSFAVLMRIADIPEDDVMEKHKFALSLISLVGISISIAALTLTFLTFAFLRFKNTRHRYFVHANLALSLGLAETLFLFGITKTANKFNFICLGKTFMIMSARGRTKKTDTTIEKIRYWSKGSALLSCLLGLTWILGVFVVNRDTIFMAYMFNIFNTLQGLFIFVFHCIGDEKVRAEYLRIIRCQTRAQAYGTARPWWSKSDSLSRSRTWEERHGKVYRRGTFQSNIDCSKTQGSVQRRANTMTGPEDVAFLERFEYKPPPEMTHIFGTVEDEYLQENAEQTEAQLNEEKGENQTDGQNEPRSCTPTSNQTSEESRKEHASVETSLTCSCKSASQSNLPDVIQTDYKGNDIAKNDSTV
ncbi:Latrophilin-1 [Stylophora pistillata]|uniref:Latrophilin-1 n=1 Tax=Stylophora pistillata TaxID=50429 RepID=A0A2B4SS16_STYPI|nr:Latrophilin-1 [Stylophora pistillata]